MNWEGVRNGNRHCLSTYVGMVVICYYSGRSCWDAQVLVLICSHISSSADPCQNCKHAHNLVLQKDSDLDAGSLCVAWSSFPLWVPPTPTGGGGDRTCSKLIPTHSGRLNTNRNAYIKNRNGNGSGMHECSCTVLPCKVLIEAQQELTVNLCCPSSVSHALFEVINQHTVLHF